MYSLSFAKVTRLQLVQFSVCFCFALYVLSSGPTNRWLALLQLFVMTNMIGLFTVYYWETYANEKPSMVFTLTSYAPPPPSSSSSSSSSSKN